MTTQLVKDYNSSINLAFQIEPDRPTERTPSNCVPAQLSLLFSQPRVKIKSNNKGEESHFLS